MSSSTTTTQLGRHVWTSIRDSVGILTARLPVHKYNSLSRGTFAHGFGQPITASSTRAFHTSRWFSLPNRAKASQHNVRRSCTSGGLLLIGLTSGPSSTPAVVATCTAATDTAFVASSGKNASISSLARLAWHRSTRPKCGLPEGRRLRVTTRRGMSSKPEGDAGKDTPPAPPPQKPANQPSHEPPAGEHESLADSMSKYLHLPHMPKMHMPHRPTKEELLAAASGFWERLKVRFKWFSIRSMRPWNADEWGAFVSWFLFGHLVWILVGTTTFFSLVILTINTVFAQGKSAAHVLVPVRLYAGADNSQKLSPNGLVTTLQNQPASLSSSSRLLCRNGEMASLRSGTSSSPVGRGSRNRQLPRAPLAQLQKLPRFGRLGRMPQLPRRTTATIPSST